MMDQSTREEILKNLDRLMVAQTSAEVKKIKDETITIIRQSCAESIEERAKNFKEEMDLFIYERQERLNGLRDLFRQWNDRSISGKELRSGMGLFRRLSYKEAQTLNHLIGEAVEPTISEGKEVNHSGVLNRPMARKGM